MQPFRILAATALSWLLSASAAVAAPDFETQVLPVLTRAGCNSDGGQEDVTPWAVCTPTDSAALRINANGEVTALRRGQSAVMVRYLGAVGSVTVTVPLADEAPQGERPRGNFIDDHVNRTLDQL